MNYINPTILLEWHKKFPSLAAIRQIKSGKEADVWLVQINSELRALKIYKDRNLSTRSTYTQGQWISEASLRKAARQNTKLGKNLQQKLWIKREYYLLKKLHVEGVHVPEVFAYTDTAILMQYLGDKNRAAHRLVDTKLTPSEKQAARQIIEQDMRTLYEIGIIHADLSPYNILWWNNLPWMIDFPQAVDIRRNPNWKELYQRDMKNMRQWFEAT